MLKFQYPGCEPFFPLGDNEPAKSTWFDGDTRVVLERDREAETALARSLKNHGLTPLHEILPAHELNDKNRHSVVLEHPTIRVSDWLEFLDSPHCRALEDAGWIIDADPKLGLTIHDVSDFFPAIEAETDHGIDWFRFDVTGEFDGQTRQPHPADRAAPSPKTGTVRYPDPETSRRPSCSPATSPTDGHIRFPARRFLEMVDQVRHLFHGSTPATARIRLDRLGAAGVADALAIDASETTRALAALGRNLRDIHGLPPAEVPATVKAELRPYQTDGFRWLQFLADHGLHGILADDMGLGKTLQTLTHLAAEHAAKTRQALARRRPHLRRPELGRRGRKIHPAPQGPRPPRQRPRRQLRRHPRRRHRPHLLSAARPRHRHPRNTRLARRRPRRGAIHQEPEIRHRPVRLHSSRPPTASASPARPMENHLGELWSLMRFLMPGFLADEKTFNTFIRKPIERDRSSDAQLALNRRVSPLILRRTKDQVATDLPAKTELIHRIDLTPKQTDLYESVRAAMDKRVRDAIAAKGLAKSHIIVLDALLKLRQICCHPAAPQDRGRRKACTESAKLEYLTDELLPTLLEEGRRILLFSQFTSMLALIEEHLEKRANPVSQTHRPDQGPRHARQDNSKPARSPSSSSPSRPAAPASI